MLIHSKFVGKCRVCGATVNVGDLIYWESGVGYNHKECGNDFTKNVLVVERNKKPLTKLGKIELFITLLPLLHGPLYFYYSKDVAFVLCLLIPILLAIFIGIRPANFRVRVKTGSRRASMLDLYGTSIMLMCGISFSVTWLIHKFIS